MLELKGRLKKELQQNLHVKIIDTQTWSIPIHTIEIGYQTIKRTKMDILMKMMLISFQKAEIESAEELSEMLLVEQLFIDDLINKMSRTGLIEKRGSIFILTEAGIAQLENGVFEHEPEDATQLAFYSPHHAAFLSGELPTEDIKEQSEFRYKDDCRDFEASAIADDAALKALRGMAIESGEGNVQVIVSEVTAISNMNITQVPCVEFRLYNEEKDLFYVRVWNTLSAQWDETLEAKLNDLERKQWRDSYLKK